MMLCSKSNPCQAAARRDLGDIALARVSFPNVSFIVHVSPNSEAKAELYCKATFEQAHRICIALHFVIPCSRLFRVD